MLKKVIRIGLIAVFVLILADIGFCQSAKKDKDRIAGGKRTTRVMKEIQGEVVGKSFNAISLCYQRDPKTGAEYEIMIPIDKKDLKIDHRESLDQIGIGDIVSIEYEETTEETDAATAISRKGKIIHFIRQANKQSEFLNSE